MGRGLVESSDVKSDVFIEGLNSSLGITGRKEGPTEEHVPYAFFPQARGPGIGYKLPFSPYFEVSSPPLTSTFPVKATSNHQHGEKAVIFPTNEPKISLPLVRNFLRRLSSTLSKRLAKNDPTLEMTNFGWRKKI